MKVLWVFFDKILFIFLLFFNSWEKLSTDRMPDGKYIHIKILCEWHAIKYVSWVIQQVERIRLTVCVCVLKSLKRQYQCLQPYTKDEWSFLTFFMHSKSLALHILLFIYKMAFLFRNMLSTIMLGKVLVQTWIAWLVVPTSVQPKRDAIQWNKMTSCKLNTREADKKNWSDGKRKFQSLKLT